MTARELNSLLRVWQERLGLSEWVIYIRQCKPQDLATYDTRFENYAECNWSTETREAWIGIVAARYHAGHRDPRVVNESIVHELMHIALEGHKPLTGKYRYDANYEYGLNKLASAIVRAYGL